ncbi:MAG TPA: ATP-binding protein [Cyanobacteria bacterium UBA11149]|nr:ATP-binding protein [Cyanobacteria bacterium UBA11367]HBE57781.1 ATP-binding protein [Cyanobacteria bacterium UBA11366]HBK62995.1 ATP-binding protein [Cyanobacteria bacterium UBA11166]HBR77248.1 ATP-binding protein [Cyanobacteria bacterium UBA11159]HBS69361.1 ATP-binding protein [Cyanobacteria bacterium UBA11153]HBW90118.1 ATP-binding protein [Cyanobacteria bacterium UBA11149]HCA97865.1 ATP-binding protein [Cyanobacteria bacterium UBA9226]
MRIKEITYCDRELEWQFEPIQFSNLTLLVGVSGVGKTQILQSIMAIRGIANGRSLNGVKWNINFSTINNLEYRWQGEFETVKSPPLILMNEDDKPTNDDFRIISEQLSLNEEIIIDRDDNGIKFKGKLLPKLSPFESVVSILSEEEDVAPVQNGFNKIIYSDQSSSVDAVHRLMYTSLTKKYLSIEKIQKSRLPTHIKLALAYKNIPEVFEKIKRSFIEIFVQVEDLKIEPYENEDLPVVFADYPFVHIKEKDVNNWIAQDRISSGMFRTLMHISELYLSPEGTVILIDEFENSLGVNCIDVVTELLLENRNIQFIITSHHPYIINNIGMEYWKIVTRKGGVVTAKDAKEYNIGNSRHQSFMQLINLDAYKEGIQVG